MRVHATSRLTGPDALERISDLRCLCGSGVRSVIDKLVDAPVANAIRHFPCNKMSRWVMDKENALAEPHSLLVALCR